MYIKMILGRAIDKLSIIESKVEKHN